MSSGAVGWVFSESPYAGAMFALHLAIGDTVNDAHENRLWASVPTLATKARVSERSVRSGLAQMVRDGLLELVAAPEGKPREYRFLMPANPGTCCTPAQAAPLQTSAAPLQRDAQTPATSRETPATTAPKPKRTQLIPTGTQETADFARFWDAYPSPTGKGAARKAWRKAIEKADPERIVAAVFVYRASKRVRSGYVKNPATWLNQECWDDEPEPASRAKGIAVIEEALHNRGVLT